MSNGYVSRIGLLLVLASPAVLSAQTVHLSDSTQRVVFDGAAFSAGTAIPQWSNGYLVSRQVETFQAGVPNVWIYDQSGNKARQAAIWFLGSQRVLVYSAIDTSDGKIIASGKTEKADGEAATSIALIRPGRQLGKSNSDNRFCPRAPGKARLRWLPKHAPDSSQAIEKKDIKSSKINT